MEEGRRQARLDIFLALFSCCFFLLSGRLPDRGDVGARLPAANNVGGE
jgi:hypothetical protein